MLFPHAIYVCVYVYKNFEFGPDWLGINVRSVFCVVLDCLLLFQLKKRLIFTREIYGLHVKKNIQYAFTFLEKLCKSAKAL